MNRTTGTLLFLIAFVIAFSIYRSRSNVVSTPADFPIGESIPMASPPVAIPKVPSVQKPALLAPIPVVEKQEPLTPNSALNPRRSGSVSAKPPLPPPHGLSYVRNGELIVVFGDVLYGKSKDAPPTGYVKAMPVETWENSTIPYFIATDLPNPGRVLQTIKYFNKHTHVRFVPFDGQADAIVFEKGNKDCLSYVGRIGGHQPIYLDDKCGQTEITHEIMHVLGFIHEQSRPDRDQYIKIHWENIELENRSQFDIAPDEITRVSTALPFDYHSIMLYKPQIFAAKPDLKTMDSVTNDAIEPADQLSRDDLNRLDKIYVQ